jgi:hypothetical protein
VLGNDTGRQVIRNALTAYAVFQAWGNTPEQFDANTTPGYKLLDELQKGQAADFTKIEGYLGIPPKLHIFDPNIYPNPKPDLKTDITQAMQTTLPKGPHLFHPSTQVGAASPYLTWNYILNFEKYQVIILDTRNWRSYPGPSAFDPPSLLSDEGFQKQIIDGAKPPTGTTPEITFVVSPAVPIPIPVFQGAQHTHDPKKILENDAEGWDAQVRALELFFAKLVSRPRGVVAPAGSPRMERVVVLSGDVHHGYAIRLQYWAHKPYETQQGETNAVFALLTSSAFRNETSTGGLLGLKSTRTLHTSGYDVFYSGVNKQTDFDFLGWENAGGATLTIGKWVDGNGNEWDWKIPGPNSSPAITSVQKQRARAIQDPQHFPKPVKLTLKTEWRYRLIYLTSIKTRQPPPSTKIGSGDQKKDFAQGTAEHEEYASSTGDGNQIVGVNNVGEITFDLEDNIPKVRIAQKLWWRQKEKAAPAPNTTHVVSLEYSEKDFPDPEVELIKV